MKTVILQVEDTAIYKFDEWCASKNVTRAFAIRQFIHKVAGLPAPQKPKRGLKQARTGG